jgi:hypothetical protein
MVRRLTQECYGKINKNYPAVCQYSVILSQALFSAIINNELNNLQLASIVAD